ncbi:Triosephosphate isomerase [Tribonema minus]|uniref:Triosephosphate isomerase n=1 Tax=Tribonema minus TaxID=303371 RepID=A0A835YH06_9STRA|nr:Triosephosphate isomerase [Tribonema minus]
MPRKYVIGGNWKCNGTVAQVSDLVSTLNKAGDFPSNAEVVIAPTFLHVPMVKDAVRSDVNVSLQNCSVDSFGAYTGEIAPEMIADFGLKWVITGHSERRTGFGGQAGETSEIVAKKTKKAIEAGLTVIACVGESLDEREAGNTLKVVLEEHLAAIADALSQEQWAKVVVAYEPVWAIGTGKTASPEQAQDVHASIRSWLSDKVSPEVAEATRIIYGGSVKGSNAGTLADCADIDGFLVGGASLKPEFIDIINAVEGK